MRVILLKPVRKLGILGDQVKVKSGFARNYLIPQHIAVHATKDNLSQFEQRRSELEKIASEKLSEAQERQKSIESMGTVTISAKAGDEGKLFGSIGTRDIADALNKAGIVVEKREVRLPAGTLRMIGTYDVAVELEGDISAIVKVNVVPETKIS